MRRLPAIVLVLAAGLQLAPACGGQAATTATQRGQVATTASQRHETTRRHEATRRHGLNEASLPPSAGPAASVPRPRIVWDPIPFDTRRKREMVAYVHRHYGSFMRPTYRLSDPHVIVIHYTETPSFRATFNTFAPDVPDPELHELPNTCAHFVIDRGGGIHQLVPLDIMCRHAVGLNWTAIGIEHVGYSNGEVLDDHAEMAASLQLVRWLRCRYGIAIREVIGHNESLSSPFHREDVAALRTQTHDDFNHAAMQVYRRRLAGAGGCP